MERAETEGFGVFFPDLPGCTSGGDTLDEAARNAEEALAMWVDEMLQAGEAIPAATPLDAVEVEEDIAVAARLLVRVEMPGKAMRVNVSIEEGLLSTIDMVAKSQGKNRSAFLADAAREAIRASRAS
ncbi:type II toxin-antitoxin system HicB family antitoxin [Roseomonas sp. USHLN139]|uniref:type II toxin-antitoxin system HicB family antitoxin n=1 Tax=Roseomonas sp. USHLN139 TaxID=3081298 RepID=UPI003B0181B3